MSNSNSLERMLRKQNVKSVGAEHKHGRPGWRQFDCPYCGPRSRKFHLGLNTHSWYFNCWKCGPHRFWPTLAELTGLTIPELRKTLGPKYSLERDSGDAFSERRSGFLRPSGLYPLSPKHRRYLAARGLSVSLVRDLYHIEGFRVAGNWRIWIPIEFDNEPVSWTTRAIENVTPRYLSAKATQESVNHKHILYAEDLALPSCVIVCEGPIDAWAIGPGAVATCGLSTTREQLWRIAKYPRRVICFDSSADAQRRATKLADSLSVFSGETNIVELQTGDDAADADVDELKELRSEFLGEGGQPCKIR